MDRGITPGGLAMWWQRATSKVCVFTHERTLALSESEMEKQGENAIRAWYAAVRELLFLLTSAIKAHHKRQWAPGIILMHADLFYLILSKYISTIIHTPCKYGFVFYLKLQSFCLWISISRLCLCFCYAKSLNKEVISWTTFLFVLSSISFQSKKGPKHIKLFK